MLTCGQVNEATVPMDTECEYMNMSYSHRDMSMW